MTKEEVLKLARSFTVHHVSPSECVDGEKELIIAYFQGEITTTQTTKALQVLHKRTNVNLANRFIKSMFELKAEGRITVS